MSKYTIDDINQSSKYKAASHQQFLIFLCLDGEIELVKWIYEEFVSNPASRKTHQHNLSISFDSNVLLCSVLSGNVELVKFILCINPDLIDTNVKAYSSESSMDLISISLVQAIKNGLYDICDYLMCIKKDYSIRTDEYEIDINILSAAFISALKHGFIDICELIISIRPNVDVTLFDYRCFYSCCGEGHLEAAKWFYSKYPNVIESIGFDIAFVYSSRRNHVELTKWLFHLKPELEINMI